MMFNLILDLNRLKHSDSRIYSTQQTIKKTPLVLRYVSHCNSNNCWTARDRICFLFCRRKDDLQIKHT